jgi:hypothetical protein
VASIRSEHAPHSAWRTSWRFPRRLPHSVPWSADINAAIARVYALFADGGDSSLIRRLAGAAFLIRVVSAAITFVSQILLARWMGGFEFGIFIYGWTWLLLIGAMVDLGLGSAAVYPRIHRAQKLRTFAWISQRQPLARIAVRDNRRNRRRHRRENADTVYRPRDRRSALSFLRRIAEFWRLVGAERHCPLL